MKKLNILSGIAQIALSIYLFTNWSDCYFAIKWLIILWFLLSGIGSIIFSNVDLEEGAESSTI